MCDATDPDRRVLVLGCGVIGLCSAILLQEARYTVDIWAADLPPNTTSNKAGAFWLPYKVGPEEKVKKWGHATYMQWKSLQRLPTAGILKRECVEVDIKETPVPFFASYTDYRPCRPDEMQEGYASGMVFQTYVINPDVCLPYLMERFVKNGGRVVMRKLESVEAAFGHFDNVVNCTGLGSRELFGDRALFAGRGQVVVARNPGFSKVFTDEFGYDGFRYIIPRQHDVILGGTYDIGNENTRVDEQVSTDILRKCGKVFEPFSPGKVEVLQEKVGLRPCRDAIRLETELFHDNTKLVVHNYGHGGGGWSLCWGCAEEVTQLITDNYISPRSAAAATL